MAYNTPLARSEKTEFQEHTADKRSVDETFFNDKPLPNFVFTHINPLASAATSLLLLLSQIKTLEEPDNITEFHWNVRQSFEQFELQARQNNCDPRIILATRYCLCTAIDEMVLCTSWGEQSLWTEQTLLSLIHKETWGGERFFFILEKLSQEGEKNIDFLEVIYIILSLGYEGKYYKQDRSVRDEICHHLYKIIEVYRMRKSKDPSPIKSLVKKEKKENFIGSKILLIILLTFSFSLILWSGFDVITYRTAKKTIAELNQLGSDNLSAIFHRSHLQQDNEERDLYDTNI